MAKYASPHFTWAEVQDKESGKLPMDIGISEDDILDFLQLLESIRGEWGHPINVSSFFRTPEHNARISSTGLTGPHTGSQLTREGKQAFAVDVFTSGKMAKDFIQVALSVELPVIGGINGIGIKGFGTHRNRYVHIDNLAREASWTYPK